MKKWIRRILDLILVLLIVYFVGIGSYNIAKSADIHILYLGSESIYITRALKCLLQLFFTILLMRVISKKTYKEWGFNLNNAKTSMKLILKFLSTFFAVELLFLLFLKFAIKENVGINYTPRILNLLVIIGFQGLFTGTSEEPLFRGLVIGVLKKSWDMRFKVLNHEIEAATILSAVVFSIAHIDFTLFPLKVLYYSPWQLLTAFLLGIYYAYAFQKTKSLLNPIIAHNAANVIIILLNIAVSKL